MTRTYYPCTYITLLRTWDYVHMYFVYKYHTVFVVVECSVARGYSQQRVCTCCTTATLGPPTVLFVVLLSSPVVWLATGY